MLDVAPTELLLVAVVAVVVIGPKDLPKAMRFAGYWVGRARGVARQFRSGFDEMIRESELAEMEKKWADENARIMREHPPASPALPAPDGESGPAADDAPPIMTAQPVVRDEPAADPTPDGAAPDEPAAVPADVTPRPDDAKAQS